MKKYLFSALMAAVVQAALFTTTACDKSGGPSPENGPDTLFVKMGQTMPVPSGGFTIRLEPTVADIRCPIDVDCIWEGRADAPFVFTKNNISENDTLAAGFTDSPGLPDGKANHFGFVIELLELSPSPTEAVPQPAQGEYVAKLLVKPE